MFLRIDRLQIELPAAKKQDPNAAAALQELLGGKFGEMSTLGNYLFQSFNFRSKSKLRPFYSLVASITAEELGHVELVSNGVAMLNAGPDVPENEVGGQDISDARRCRMPAAGSSLPVERRRCHPSTAMAPRGTSMVTTTGNLAIDLLRPFTWSAARIHKLRHETMTEPTGRGLWLPPGARLVHAHAYALALKKITGVAITDAANAEHQPRPIPECQKYRRWLTAAFIAQSDDSEIAGIWANGEVALQATRRELEVVDGAPEGGRIHDLMGDTRAFSPEYAPEEMG
jgi:Mn-containing catalase